VLSLINPDVHAGAYDEFLPGALERARTQREWTPADGPLPALYISHGAPPLFNDARWLRELLDWTQSLPKPKAILIVSAHWEAAPLCLSAAAHTPLVYDFGGFDQRYYTMTYDTPGATALARQVAALMPAAEPVCQHPNRGLDHGAWVPLMAIYPLADIPVLQLSLPTHDPDKLLAIGSRLAELRHEGVMVIGSGFMTHGIRFLTQDMLVYGKVPGWSADFDAWAAEAHYLPLFITLGASGEPERPVTTKIDGYMLGFARRSFEAG
jgi:4,5-DOPA dioxygenase extradiol